MKIYANRPEGNAFTIMGTVRSLLAQTGRKDEIPAVMERMTSGDYDNLCAVAEEVSNGSIEIVRDNDSLDDYEDDD